MTGLGRIFQPPAHRGREGIKSQAMADAMGEPRNLGNPDAEKMWPHRPAIHHSTFTPMKIRKTETEEKIIDVDVDIRSVGLHFAQKGIIAMVRLEDTDPDEVEDVLIEWDEVFSWAQASSQDIGDVEVICAALRKVADDLQAWDESFS